MTAGERTAPSPRAPESAAEVEGAVHDGSKAIVIVVPLAGGAAALVQTLTTVLGEVSA